MKNFFIALLLLSGTRLMLFAGSPQLIWHKDYGENTLTQPVLVTAIDNYDNLFAAGFVNFGNYGNVIINRYDGVGNLKWNRIYDNVQTSFAIDKPVALFPDNLAGVTMVAYTNGRATLTHILKYSPSGTLLSDVVVGDTATGNRTAPLAVLYDGVTSYYMLGQLNSVASVFKCDYTGAITWSKPLRNDYNTQVGAISFDAAYNIIVAVCDSTSPQVIVRRFDKDAGTELSGFNTHVDSLPANDNFIKMQVDQTGNVFVAGTGTDSAGRAQWMVHKFDNTGTELWSTLCNSAKGHSNTVNTFMLDHVGDVLISGPFSDDTDTWQYGAVYKIPNQTGVVKWSVIDSQFLVNNASVRVDYYDFVYLGTTKTPSAISPYYSNFSFSQIMPDSGIVQYNRSFDNTANNSGMLMQVNNFGDIFIATNTTTDSSSTWFLARVGNSAGDTLGTAVNSIQADQTYMQVYPNPFSLTTSLGFNASATGEASLQVLDITGRVLQQQPAEVVAGYNRLTLNTHLAAGTYLLRLSGNGISAVRRVVVY